MVREISRTTAKRSACRLQDCRISAASGRTQLTARISPRILKEERMGSAAYDVV